MWKMIRPGAGPASKAVRTARCGDRDLRLPRWKQNRQWCRARLLTGACPRGMVFDSPGFRPSFAAGARGEPPVGEDRGGTRPLARGGRGQHGAAQPIAARPSPPPPNVGQPLQPPGARRSPPDRRPAAVVSLTASGSSRARASSSTASIATSTSARPARSPASPNEPADDQSRANAMRASVKP